MAINRRQFMTGALAWTAGAMLGPGAAGLARAAATAPTSRFNFRAAETTISLGQGPSFKALTFNSQMPGPEIRVKEGR